MSTPEGSTEPEHAIPPGSGIMSGGMGVLFFVFGLAAGVLMAYSAVGFLEESISLILTVFLSALLVLLVLGILVYA
jgi:hypothetical protein